VPTLTSEPDYATVYTYAHKTLSKHDWNRDLCVKKQHLLETGAAVVSSVVVASDVVVMAAVVVGDSVGWLVGDSSVVGWVIDGSTVLGWLVGGSSVVGWVIDGSAVVGCDPGAVCDTLVTIG